MGRRSETENNRENTKAAGDRKYTGRDRKKQEKAGGETVLNIKRITAEYVVNPVGITKAPRFSWVLESEERNTRQTGYTLEIALDEAFEQVIYRKCEETDHSIHNKYEDFVMKSLTKYFWRVDVADNHGNHSGFSEPGFFVTGFLDNGEWKAGFITAERETDAGNSKGTWLRKSFEIKGGIDHAYVCATALGLYQLYLDGERVGEDEMTPGWTSYHKHLCYQTYDVTRQLSAGGKHCELRALVGAGYYKGKMGILHLRNNYGDRTAFLCELHIVYRDGSEQVVMTDETWQGADSPVLFAEIYDGEIYDARLEEREAWRPVWPVGFDKNALTAQASGKIAVMEEFPVKRLFTTPAGELVADFGQNMAGWVKLRLRDTKPGEKLEIRCFETLDKDGNVYTDNLRSAKATLTYYCKGAEREECTPHFTYMGFRYAWIVSGPGTVRAEDITAYALYSEMERTGLFRCSNPDLNRLWSNITWSLKSNFFDIPTDCPQRDERLGWTGDAQIFCRTASYIMNTFLFFEKWLIDVAADQTKEGGVPHVVPDIITPNTEQVTDWLLSQGTHSAAAWADVAVLNPWNLYLTFGDTQILIDQYDSMRAWIRFMETHADGVIWNYKLQFGDWVALDAEEGSYLGATPNDLTCTAYYAYSTGIFAKIAGILGKKEDEAYFGALSEKIRAGFAERFFDPMTKGMTVQTQTAHIIALYFGLTPEAYREQTVKELLELLAREDGHLVTGFVGTPYFAHALSQNGHLREAYELLLKEDFPSWLYQVKRGATTVWEHWDGIKPDGSMWSADMNSFNHYAYGSIGEWLVRVAAGIEIDEQNPGYHRAILYPRPGGGLRLVQAAYESQYGTVGCTWSWNQDSNSLTVVYDVPVNAGAELCLDSTFEITESDGLEFTETGDRLTAEAGSGVYRIRAKRR